MFQMQTTPHKSMNATLNFVFHKLKYNIQDFATHMKFFLLEFVSKCLQLNLC